MLQIERATAKTAASRAASPVARSVTISSGFPVMIDAFFVVDVPDSPSRNVNPDLDRAVREGTTDRTTGPAPVRVVESVIISDTIGNRKLVAIES